MRILIDDEIFIYQRYGGVSRIFSNLIRALKSDSEFELLFSAFYSENEYLENIQKAQIKPYLKNLHFPLKGKLLRFILKKISHKKTIDQIQTGNIDIFHPSFYSNYYINAIIQTPNIKLVYTVHDLIHERFPHSKDYRNIAHYKSENIRLAKQIIVVSENTKKDLLLYYPEVNPEIIHVNYLYASLPKQAEIINDLPNEYVLHIGERSGYKNFNTLLDAFARLRQVYPNLYLVCSGSRPFSRLELLKFKQLGISNFVIRKAVNEKQLVYLYQNAKIFVFPSTYEGFGIPILEAFECRTPCILSRSSSLPEVADDAALYFNPEDSSELYMQMKYLLSNENIRIELIDKGIERLKYFSLDKHIETTKAIYKLV